MSFAVVVAAVFLVGATIGAGEKLEDGNCEKLGPVASKMCNKKDQGFAYEYTSFPNFFKHRFQDEVAKEIMQFQPLVKINCHKHLSLLLCSLFYPVCTPGLQIQVPPCRSLCLDVKSGCEPLMKKFGFAWPFNCTAIAPAHDDKVPCVRAVDPEEKGQKGEEATTKSNGAKAKKQKGWTKLEENESVDISCKKNKTVLIRKVKHSDSSCCPSASLAVLTAICNGQSSCGFTNNESSLGGHCKGKVGQMSLRHKCVRSQKEKPCPGLA